ncbi:ParA family protein [Kitasatospora sp. NPDC008115]|uniref:ParA family protein n=1 Tax=Kitasatospora sp. NPDC008115 TaxID=3364022 RepID=UPI0036E4D818
MTTYAFWNNKGGTGKTSLAFQALTLYAHENPGERILAVDVCPQANLSELLYGGLAFRGSEVLLARQGEPTRRTIGGYFELRLTAPFAPPTIVAADYVSKPNQYNQAIPENIDLIAGDPLLEMQATAMSALANTSIPTTNSWLRIIDWIKDLLEAAAGDYDTVFIDTNPSFSMYTQVALSAADKLVLPVMADDSSRRAIQNAFSLIYGLRLPSEIYTQYAFATRLREAGRDLPRVHLIAKNRLTQYMGAASAYAAVLHSIDRDIEALMASNPDMFTFDTVHGGIVEIRDFQTAGVVAQARGCPLYAQRPGKLDIMGHRVQVKADYLDNCVIDAKKLVAAL